MKPTWHLLGCQEHGKNSGEAEAEVLKGRAWWSGWSNIKKPRAKVSRLANISFKSVGQTAIEAPSRELEDARPMVSICSEFEHDGTMSQHISACFFVPVLICFCRLILRQASRRSPLPQACRICWLVESWRLPGAFGAMRRGNWLAETETGLSLSKNVEFLWMPPTVVAILIGEKSER